MPAKKSQKRRNVQVAPLLELEQLRASYEAAKQEIKTLADKLTEEKETNAALKTEAAMKDERAREQAVLYEAMVKHHNELGTRIAYLNHRCDTLLGWLAEERDV